VISLRSTNHPPTTGEKPIRFFTTHECAAGHDIEVRHTIAGLALTDVLATSLPQWHTPSLSEPRRLVAQAKITTKSATKHPRKLRNSSITSM
jgi:hypothetical protein